MTRVQVVSLLIGSALSASTSVAWAQLPACSQFVTTNCVTGAAGAGGIVIDGNTAEAGELSEAPATDARDRTPSATYIERRFVPSCTGNTPDAQRDALCEAATTVCPDPVEVQHWVFAREVERATGDALTPWRIVDTVCLGPDAPEIDPLVAIPGLVQRQFQSVVVRKGVPEISPRPETLVNVPTVFTTPVDDAYQIPLTLLGQSVVITATPREWSWTFGDGQSGSTRAPGTDGRVEHEYRQTGDLQAFVTIEWSGTFSVNGGPAQTITGTATTVGDPVVVQVRQARTELVRD